jgi:uncharacterized protein
VKPFANNYVSNRVLKLNIGFLLSDGPGHNHDSIFDVPAVRVADDVFLKYIKGPIRLSRTKEGILVQGKLEIGIEDECYRCLEPVSHTLSITLEELYSYQTSGNAEFRVYDDGILDLAPLLRAEALIILSRGMVCRDDCKGLCPDCGANLNDDICDCGLENVDPRLAQLKQLLDRK